MNKITISEWFSKQPDYGILHPPMDAQTAIYFLFDYLDIPYDIYPESTEQSNTFIVVEILKRHSKKFRKERKELRKKYKKRGK